MQRALRHRRRAVAQGLGDSEQAFEFCAPAPAGDFRLLQRSDAQKRRIGLERLQVGGDRRVVREHHAPFRAQLWRREVRASCFEFFGDTPEPPPDATVYFRGQDPRLGRLTKYTVVHRDDDAR